MYLYTSKFSISDFFFPLYHVNNKIINKKEGEKSVTLWQWLSSG